MRKSLEPKWHKATAQRSAVPHGDNPGSGVIVPRAGGCYLSYGLAPEKVEGVAPQCSRDGKQVTKPRAQRPGAHLEGKVLPKVWVQRLPMHLGLMPPPLVWQQVDPHVGVGGAPQVQGCQSLSLNDAHQQLKGDKGTLVLASFLGPLL